MNAANDPLTLLDESESDRSHMSAISGGAWQRCSGAMVAHLLCAATIAWGDGGQIRTSEMCGNLCISVFTSPNPMRAGPVDISVLITDDNLREVVMNADVMIKLWRDEDADVPLLISATHSAATNKLYYAAKFVLPTGGLWTVQVMVGTPDTNEPVTVEFLMKAQGPLASWRSQLTSYILWIVFVVLFVIHRALVARREAWATCRGHDAP